MYPTTCFYCKNNNCSHQTKYIPEINDENKKDRKFENISINEVPNKNQNKDSFQMELDALFTLNSQRSSKANPENPDSGRHTNTDSTGLESFRSQSSKISQKLRE